MAWHPFRHLHLKVAALALGTLLWLTVSGHQVTRRVPVSVSYSNIPATFEMTSDQDDNTTVLIRGDDRTVSELGPGALRVIVDLRDAHPGSNLITLHADEVVAPGGIEVLQVSPGVVTVTLEHSVQQPAIVRPTLQGQPAPGYVVGEVMVEPRTITVVGPQSRLASPVSVFTERIVLDGRTSTLSAVVNVDVADSRVRLQGVSRVRVTVRIEPERQAR